MFAHPKVCFSSFGLPFKNLIAKDIMLPSKNEKKNDVIFKYKVVTYSLLFMYEYVVGDFKISESLSLILALKLPFNIFIMLYNYTSC